MIVFEDSVGIIELGGVFTSFTDAFGLRYNNTHRC
jgi:hypothetical protein